MPKNNENIQKMSPFRAQNYRKSKKFSKNHPASANTLFFRLSLDRCRDVLAAQPFTLERYVENLFTLIKEVREKIDKTCRLHLAGHSYGSASLLWALLQMRRKELPPPASCSFLAPFVKIDLGGRNPAIALEVVNRRFLAGRFPPNHDAQMARLRREVAGECRRWYECRIVEDFLDDHRRFFNQAFFAALAGLEEFMAPVDIKVFRGSSDQYIGEAHIDLLRSYFGEEVNVCMFADDDHDVSSVQPADLFNCK